MKLTKFGILANKTTLFTSIRDSKFQRSVEKILEIPEGRGSKFWGPILEKARGEGGYTANPFRGGGMDYFLEPHISVHLSVLISVAILLNTEMTAIFQLNKD